MGSLQMKTSCFKYYKGEDGVAICIYPPADWTGCRYPALEPDRQTFYAVKAHQINNEQFEKLYREQTLSRLDPKEIYNLFKHNVLLCWELPGEPCHRRIIAKWIEENLHIEVPEWDPSQEHKKSNNTTALF